MASIPRRDLIHLGMDVHKDSISIATLRPDDSMDVERIFHDEASVRRFLHRFPDRRSLSTCYEAGPTGYELHRLIEGMGIRCDVVAPSLICRVPTRREKALGTGVERTVRDLARRRGLRIVKARSADGYFVVNAYTNTIITSEHPVDLETAREVIMEYVLLSEWDRTPEGGTLSGRSARENLLSYPR